MADMAIIAGAGPAGLTTALELLETTDVIPLVFEADTTVGGLSKTINYRGNRLDIGGHRFFSKSTRVMDWWTQIMPVQGGRESDPGWLSSVAEAGPDPAEVELVMLLRERRSRILYLGRMFDYPVSLNANTVRNLGPWRMAKIAASYARARLLPIRSESTLEEFMINRFGRELYRTFFEDYTEKVWGVPCSQIKADWGAQRIKGLSVSKVLRHALGRVFSRGSSDGDIYQKGSETSLIERFLYPKRGPGQLWEEVARQVTERGGQIHLGHTITAMEVEGDRIVAATVRDSDGRERRVAGDYFISTMPVRELIAGMGDVVPSEVREVAQALDYRDFITVGVLLRRREGSRLSAMSDNWIYVQEPEVKVGRLQIFNNWSPYLVGEPDTLWVGMEYFANEGDALWSMSDAEMSTFALAELAQLELIQPDDVLDNTVIRVPKAYPAYFGSYDRFDVIRAYVDTLKNLFLIGRNGMHRYNNQDHSILTAFAAVENIAHDVDSKDNIWDVNVEREYHETKSVEEQSDRSTQAAVSDS
jgi:protoporphyrinogen oxidase